MEPLELNVRRTGQSLLWVLIITLRCGVATFSGTKKLDMSSSIFERTLLYLLYHDLILGWYKEAMSLGSLLYFSSSERTVSTLPFVLDKEAKQILEDLSCM